MKTTKTSKISRWGILTIAGILVILLVGSAIYAQGQFGPRRDGQRGGGGRDGHGWGQGPGRDGGHGPGRQGPGAGHGPQAMIGAQFLMQDPEIMDLMAMIKVVEGINRLELTTDQVEAFVGFAVEAQGIMKSEFGDTRDQIKAGLKEELNNVLAGGEHDPGTIREIMEDARESHDPGAIKEELEGILDQAIDLLTDEQFEKICDRDGEGRREMRERFGDRFGDRWDDLTDEEREEIEQRIENRINEAREGAVRMGIMMLLLSPKAVDGMELWLDAN